MMVEPPRRVPGSTNSKEGPAGAEASASALPTWSKRGESDSRKLSSLSSRQPSGLSASAASAAGLPSKSRPSLSSESNSSSSSMALAPRERFLPKRSSLRTLAALTSQGRALPPESRGAACRTTCSRGARATRTGQTGWPVISPNTSMRDLPSSSGCDEVSSASTRRGAERHSGFASQSASGRVSGPEPTSTSRASPPWGATLRGSGRGRLAKTRVRRTRFQGRK